MNFASSIFWIQLAICALIAAFISLLGRKLFPKSASAIEKWVLFATAISLLARESLVTLACFLWVVIIAWFSINALRRSECCRGLVLGISIGLQLLPLFYYKYWGFFFNELLQLNLEIPSILIPMGLSFYTFQTISLVVDQNRNPVKLRFLDFLNFCSFFPQIVAGPIERRDSLLSQMRSFSARIDFSNLNEAVSWILLGLFYKIALADNLAVVGPAMDFWSAGAYGGWLESLHYGYRIYFDFAGYSFIAFGLAAALGVRVTLNFRAPYFATDLRDFWRRWHISLSQWLRDYVYFPLGGSRTKFWAVNVLIVFVVSGIWHGAGWGFIVWGFLHGFGVLVSGLAIVQKIPTVLRWGLTFAFAIFAWMYFFENDLDAIYEKTQTLLSPAGYKASSLSALKGIAGGAGELVTFVGIMALCTGVFVLEAIDRLRGHVSYEGLRCHGVLLPMVFLLVWLAPKEEATFIYFNF